jgi:hypothetical protein
MPTERHRKLHIHPMHPSELPDVSVMFNPNSYAIGKAVSWSPPWLPFGARGETDRSVNAPSLVFGGGGSRTLSLELFFDVTEPVDGRVVEDVRQETDAIVRLTRIERKLGRPPVCRVAWGDDGTSLDFPFVGVITGLSQNFTLFSSSGAPLRATLGLSFLEYLDPRKDQILTDPELTTYVVRRGDTLPGIAAALYGDAAKWRVIAEANDVVDARRLPVGATLTIPQVD